MAATEIKWKPRALAHALAWALLPGLLAPALAQTGGGVSQSPQPPQPPQPQAAGMIASGAAQAATAGVRTRQYTLRQLGALYPMQLRGIGGINSVPFAVRADEVVVGARFKLDYSYSPSMLEGLSHIKILVNDEVAATLPTPNADGGKNLRREVAVPARMITEFNRLGVELIGHYTTQECEDPQHSSLWANIGNSSVLELDVMPVALANDLALLPLPFFDRRDVAPLNLPFVFAGSPGTGELEAAGTLASWFGALADYRTARFSAERDLPARGNAVVLLAGRASVGGVQAPADLSGPTVSVQANPRDPNGKLLVLAGRDAEELKLAVRAVALGSQALSGARASITSIDNLKPRQPYDAPKWLRSDRPVRFGELAQPKDLEVSGYSPDLIRVNLRLPPDLYAWRDKGMDVSLRYRYTPRLASSKATLNVNANQQFLTAFPLTAVGYQGDSAVERLVNRAFPPSGMPRQADFSVPLFKLPSLAQLQFHYFYEVPKDDACRSAPLDNVKGVVDADSTVDISGLPHFLAMPNLAVFGNSGFPFSRLADLSQTAVVLPNGTALTDWSSYLNLMGHMGDSTGYPATAVTVVRADQVASVADKDLLVLASGDNQPLLKEWGALLPTAVGGEERRFQLSDLTYKVANWWSRGGSGDENKARAAIRYRGEASEAYLTGFESPLAPGRSVVVVAGNSAQGLQGAVTALVDKDQVARIQGSLAVVSGGEVESLVSDQTYYIGNLGPVRYVQWFLGQRPWLMVLGGLAGALLLALAWYLALRGRAQARLERK